jgi:tetraacyldisaccharide 4'-kinase
MRPGHSLAHRVETRVRGAWTERPREALRIAAAGFATAAALRNLLYDSGVFATRQAPIPVVSVGGLTVGGSGKTPITADICARLSTAGVPTAILTHGFADEMDVHRRLSPGSRVYGGRDRLSLTREAAAAGARIAVLDSGFQYRRLHRDLDILTVDVATMGRRPEYLPAGPYREGLASLARADLVVTVRRSVPDPRAAADSSVRLADRGQSWLDPLVDAAGSPPLVSARIQPGPLVAANEAARGVEHPCPKVAVAGIMWPEVFFAQVKLLTAGVRETVGLRDHARLGDSLAGALRTLAGDCGIVCTLKDVMKLGRALGGHIPIWYLSEEVIWEVSDTTPFAVRAALALLSADASDSGRSGTG